MMLMDDDLYSRRIVFQAGILKLKWRLIIIEKRNKYGCTTGSKNEDMKPLDSSSRHPTLKATSFLRETSGR
jgi:hypothetical protein